MNSTLFRGSAAALVTPFADDRLDLPSFARLIERQIALGSDALVVLGTTGEPATLSTVERDLALAFAVEQCAGRVPVVAGTGSNSTDGAVRLARRAQRLGADAVLTVTPYYNKATQAGLAAHFTAVADAVDIPLILYNVPARTGVNLLPETAARLMEHPNIRGVKEASGDIAQIAELLRLVDGRMAVYSGSDELTLPILALGGQGVVSVAANVVPDMTRELVAAWFRGDADRSRMLQLRLLPLCGLLFREVSPIPVKAALSLMGLCRADVRLPLTTLSAECWEPLRRTLAELEEDR